MKFLDAADIGMRTAVLNALPGVIERSDLTEFTVTRTNDRKGHRDERPYLNDSPYQSDPKTRVRIEFEVYDNVTPEFAQVVADVIELERVKAKAAQQAKVRSAHDELVRAQAAYNAALAEETRK